MGKVKRSGCSTYEEIELENKEEYLKANYPFEGLPSMDAQKLCLHCGKVFTVKDFKVIREKDGEEYIMCAYSPNCDGTVLDWVEPET